MGRWLRPPAVANLQPTPPAKRACGRCAARSQVSFHRVASESTLLFLALSKRRSGSERPCCPKPLRHARRLQAMIPLNRVGRAEDIANAVLFHASDEAAYIQGAELVVDGGVLGSAAAAPAHRR